MLLAAQHSDALDRLHLWLVHDEGLAVWLTAVATVGLAAGVIIAWFAVRDAKRTRHGQLILSLNDQWNSDVIKASMKLYGTYTDERLSALVGLMFDPTERQPSPEELSDYEGLAASANLIETIGVLCDENSLTPDVIYKVWGGIIVGIWRPWRTALPQMRAFLDEEDVFKYFKAMGEAMEARLPEANRGSSGRGPQADGAADSGTSGSSSHASSARHPTESSTPSAGSLLRIFAGLAALFALGRILQHFFPSDPPSN